MGFTIVELIVAISVIAVLALISIVAYAKIHERAYNVRIIAGVKSYLNLLEIYKVRNGSYPETTPEKDKKMIAVVCLGKGYPDDYCGKVSGVRIYTDSLFNKSIEEIGSWSGVIHDQSLPSGPEVFTGAVYGNDILDTSLYDGSGYGRTIQHALYGSGVNCGVSGARSYRLTESPPVTACEILLESLPSP